MFVLFVCRLTKTFFAREASGPEAYHPPEDFPNVSLVDDSIQGWLDTMAVVHRVATEEGWRQYTIEFGG